MNFQGKNERVGGRIASFIVAIYYGTRVVLCEKLESNINGEIFSKFVREKFSGMFKTIQILQ